MCQNPGIAANQKSLQMHVHPPDMVIQVLTYPYIYTYMHVYIYIYIDMHIYTL